MWLRTRKHDGEYLWAFLSTDEEVRLAESLQRDEPLGHHEVVKDAPDRIVVRNIRRAQQRLEALQTLRGGPVPLLPSNTLWDAAAWKELMDKTPLMPHEQELFRTLWLFVPVGVSFRARHETDGQMFVKWLHGDNVFLRWHVAARQPSLPKTRIWNVSADGATGGLLWDLHAVVRNLVAAIPRENSAPPSLPGIPAKAALPEE